MYYLNENQKKEEITDDLPTLPGAIQPSQTDEVLQLKLQRMREAAERAKRHSSTGMIHSSRALSARGQISQYPKHENILKKHTSAPSCTIPTETNNDEYQKVSPLHSMIKDSSLELERELAIRGILPVYDPESRQQIQPKKTVLDMSDKRGFLMKPPPKDYGMVQCYVVRERTTLNKLYPKFYFYHEKDKLFLLAARKRVKNKSANYLISLDKDDLKRTSGSYFGKLRSNFWGTEFLFYDKGDNAKVIEQTKRPIRNQLGAVLFEVNVLGMKGPRKISVIIPEIGKDGKPVQFPEVLDAPNIIERYKSGQTKELIMLTNKYPTWNEKVKAFVLNFNGRVSKPSVKNFQLEDPENPEKTVLQFGKVSDNNFTLDYGYPLTGMQAFCIALAAFDTKLGCG